MTLRGEPSRDLLLGLLALQNGLIDQAQLCSAFHAWSADRTRPLVEHLANLGILDAERRALLEALVTVFLERHGPDPEKYLDALTIDPSTRERLAATGDSELAATLSYVGSASATVPRGPGPAGTTIDTATSGGQRYRVIRPHARGGLGAVFVALDSELNREVALKQILDRHADDPGSRGRFLLEAEITGGLEHPGIVPVYGLGTYDNGRPYYAMRFIRGDSLKQAIETYHGRPAAWPDPGAGSLELRKLLRRFVDVCNAVGYAHSRGVLHRDIKPGNVIVGRYGETLVVDWGLAKPMDAVEAGQGDGEHRLAPISAGGSAETLPGMALGTPAYMSPEQASGALDQLGPWSDVFSLGATLYHILTGQPPFQGAELLAVLEAARKAEFVPPRQTRPEIDRGLEAVCLKAMSARPEDRYRNTRELAEDVERWMADEPVTAFREPAWQRLRRWGRRHRSRVTAGVAAMLVALIGTAAVLAVQTRANRELRLANNALDAANRRERARFDLAMDAIRLFHGEVSEDLLLREKPFDALRAKLLRGAAEFYGKVETSLEGQLDRRSRTALASAYEGLGELTARIGEKSRAMAVQEKAVALRRALATGPDVADDDRSALARALVALGHQQELTGGTVQALVSLQEARDLAERLKARSNGPATAEILKVQADALGALGRLLLRETKSMEALEAHRRALENWRRLNSDNSKSPTFRGGLAMCHFDLAQVLSEIGNFPEALKEQAQSLEILRQLADEHPDVAAYQSDLARSYSGRGLLLARIGKSDEELAAYQQALEIQKKLLEANPTIVKFQSDVAWSLNNIAAVYSETGKQAESLATHRQSLEIRRKLAADNPRDTTFQGELATSHHNLANTLSEMDRLPEAIAAYGESIAILEKLVASNPEINRFPNLLARCLHHMGARQFELGDNEASRKSLERAATLRRGLAKASPEFASLSADLAETLNSLGVVQYRIGQIPKALAQYREALAVWGRVVAKEPEVSDHQIGKALVLCNIGNVIADLGRDDEGLRLLEEALGLTETLLHDKPDDPWLRLRHAWNSDDVARLHLRSGRNEQAALHLAHAESSLRGLLRTQPEHSLARYVLVQILRNQAEVHRRAGRTPQARATLRETLSQATRLTNDNPSNPDHRDLASAVATDLAMMLIAEGQRDEALQLLTEGLRGLGRIREPGPQTCYEMTRAEAVLGQFAPDSRARALDAFRRAITLGFRDRRGAAIDPALDALRSGPEFALLMLDAAMPEEPFSP